MPYTMKHLQHVMLFYEIRIWGVEVMLESKETRIVNKTSLRIACFTPQVKLIVKWCLVRIKYRWMAIL